MERPQEKAILLKEPRVDSIDSRILHWPNLYDSTNSATSLAHEFCMGSVAGNRVVAGFQGVGPAGCCAGGGAQMRLQAIAMIGKQLHYLLGFFVPFTTITVGRGGIFLDISLRALRDATKASRSPNGGTP